MKEEEKHLEDAMKGQAEELNRLTRLDGQAQARAQAERKYKTTMKRKEQFKDDAVDQIKKMKEQFEKDRANLDVGFEDERKRQIAELEANMKTRRDQVEANKQAKKDAALLKARQEAEAIERKYVEVREMRIKRDTLEKTIIDGQRLIFKGCYSRPLWSYNARLAD